VHRRAAYRRTEERNRLETEAHPEKWIQQGADVDAQDSDRAANFSSHPLLATGSPAAGLETRFLRRPFPTGDRRSNGDSIGIKTRLELSARRHRPDGRTGAVVPEAIMRAYGRGG
jgi:hypothetical protein